MDAKDLVGSWGAESGDSNVEFKADGTYIRVSSFTMPMTYETIALDDEGPYTVSGDTVTFSPTSGHYRRNGVDEGFDGKVRQQQVRLVSDGTTTNLLLDDAVWTRNG